MASPVRFTTSLELPQLLPGDWGYVARALASSERLFDFVAILAAICASDALARALRPASSPRYGEPVTLLCAAAFGVIFVFLLDRHGGYRPCLSLLAIRETERVLRVTLQSFAVALVGAYAVSAHLSRVAVAAALLFVPLSLTLEKWTLYHLLMQLRMRGHGTRRAVILGTGSAARRIYTALVQSPKLGVEPVAFVEEGATTEMTEIYECSYRRKHSAKVVSGPLRQQLFRDLEASVLVIADPMIDRQDMLLKVSQAAEFDVTTYFAAEELVGSGLWVDYAELDGIMLARLSKGSTRVLYRVGKRVLDVVIAVPAALLAAPLAALIAVLVKRTSSGPVFFRQTRVGKAGRPFTIYKFRTMYEDAPDYGYSPDQIEDPRVTPLGRFLRRTSLDELPQLINVLLGQMSIVGPRPEMPFIVGQYNTLQRQRLTVKPGMTGLWQISADRAFQIHESPEYDLYYRIHIISLRVPPLRERPEDIEALSRCLLRNISQQRGRGEMRISSAAMRLLEQYPWPGNIRELRNVLERAALLAPSDTLWAEHLHLHSAPAQAFNFAEGDGTLKQMERAYIAHVLQAERGSVERTARRLGIPRSSLYNKMKRFEIPQGTGRSFSALI